MSGCVGDGASGGAFLSGRGIEGEHGGMDVLSLPEGVKGALILRGTLSGFPDLVAGAIHDFVGLGPVGIGLVGEEGSGRDGLRFMKESGGEESGVPDFFGAVAGAALAGVQAIGGIVLLEEGAGDRGKLVGFRAGEESDHMLHVPSAFDELGSEPIEEFDMRRPVSLIAGILERFGNAASVELVPQSIDKDAGGEGIFLCDEPVREVESGGIGLVELPKNFRNGGKRLRAGFVHKVSSC